MDQRQVGETLLWQNVCWHTPERTRTLARLSEIYEAQGVIANAEPRALHRCCPLAHECWARDQPPQIGRATREPGETGSIFWPWVGEQYEAGGVCLVSLNINNAKETGGTWWSITVEYAIAEATIGALQAGRYKPHRSWFAYRTMSTALAVLASIDGQDPVEQPRPEEAVAACERVARIQAIKCSPTHDFSRPTQEMHANCPPKYAAKELEVLAPGVLVALGGAARDAVGLLGEVSWSEHQDHFHRGTLKVSGRQVDVLGLPHPTSRGRNWADGQRGLVASLQATRLRAASTGTSEVAGED